MGKGALTIGMLASHAEVNIETIRYYQRRGLLIEPPKPKEGYRHYPADSVDRVRFIKRAQKLGFTLDEIATLLELGDGHCAETKQLALHKLQLIEARLADLNKMRNTIKALVNQCETGGEEMGCPIVASLGKVDGVD